MRLRHTRRTSPKSEYYIPARTLGSLARGRRFCSSCWRLGDRATGSKTVDHTTGGPGRPVTASQAWRRASLVPTRSHPASRADEPRRRIWLPRALSEARPRGFEPLTFGSVEGGPSGPVCRVFIENSLHSKGFRRGHERTARAMRRRDLLPPCSHPCSHRSPDRSRASASPCGLWRGWRARTRRTRRGRRCGCVQRLVQPASNPRWLRPKRAGIIIRVFGVRVPPPPSRPSPARGFSPLSTATPRPSCCP